MPAAESAVSSSRTNRTDQRLLRASSSGARAARSVVLALLLVAASRSLAQSTPPGLDLLGTSVPPIPDSGETSPLVLAVKLFSDVSGQVLGCSFYKSPANVGVHIVTLWDAAGKVLATQSATGETPSGKQTVLFSSPVPVAAKQTFVCGYFAPNGHFSYAPYYFTAQKDAPPLHVPVNGGAYAYGSQATVSPTSISASNYWVDVLFASSLEESTWISWVNASATTNAASITWRTSAPADSQVDYGSSTNYGSSSAVNSAMVTNHSVTVTGLSPGTTYHFRPRSRDAGAVLAIGGDLALTLATPLSVTATPATATVASGATQQFTAQVSNSLNTAVTWRTTAGTIGGSGLFTAPTVTSATLVYVTATSQADPTKTASVSVNVNPSTPVLAVSPTSLSFDAQVGGSSLTPQSVSITNTGGGSLTFTGSSDQSWLMFSAGSGTAPSTVQISPSLTGLTAGTHTGHIRLTGGGATKTVTVVLLMTSPPVQHSVALSWKPSPDSGVVSYSVYRSTTSGSSYGLLASAIGGPAYTDSSVESGTVYYYVITAVDHTGRESGYSNEARTAVP
jgi:Domain of unknown function (DUF4082)/Purple acid Phosphatase, N-terminal domain/Viral BACON domain